MQPPRRNTDARHQQIIEEDEKSNDSVPQDEAKPSRLKNFEIYSNGMSHGSFATLMKPK